MSNDPAGSSVAATRSVIVDTTVAELRGLKRLAEKAIAQLDSDEQLWRQIDPEANSIGVLVRHMAGNMRSRFIDFRTSDGEKPDRQRDQEFADTRLARAELLAEWEDGWQRVFSALDAVTDADLQDTVFIREEPHTIYKAMVRQVAHYAGHVYQIVLLAKHLRGSAWQTLSVPRGQSEAFNQRMREKQRLAARDRERGAGDEVRR